MTEPWRIYLLGGLRAEQGAVVVERFRSQKFGGLLAYLALFPGRSHPREELADRFWPDSDVEAARASLRQALASLRRQMEPPPLPMGSVLETDRLYIRLNPDAVRVDVAAFEAAFEAAVRAAAARPDPLDPLEPLSEAASLYRGDLLPGFYDDWVLTERERLRHLYFEVLERLAAAHRDAGRLSEAIEVARRLVAAETTREGSHRLLMRHLIAAGRPGEAVRQYEELARTLRDRWDAAPDAETEALAEEARNAPASPASPASPEPLAQPDPQQDDAAPAAEAVPSAPSPGAAPAADAPEPEPETAVRLPLRFNRFFGRSAEIAQVHELLLGDDRVPVITVTGPGGAGKTRLAIEAAEAVGDLFAGGISFVSLADVSDASRVEDAIADALGAVRAPKVPPRQAAISTLRRRAARGRVLVVLDNAEHLVEAVVEAVLGLLGGVPLLSLLVTSRVRLELEGEREVALLPLPVPELPGTPERLLEFPAVALFADRARRALPDFALTPRNAAAVAALCQRLEGIPLALELAAARAVVMTPAQMLEQVSERYDFLVSRRRDLPERHRSLRAAVAWSVDLLSPEERGFLARLSVFRGGCTLDAAREVCGGGDAEKAIELLTGLRGASLVLAEPGGDPDAMRYRMLETVREYADSMLDEEERIELQRKHALWCCRFSHAEQEHYRTPEEVNWLCRMNAELPNFRAAIEWSLAAQTDTVLPLRLIRGVETFFEARNLFAEARSYLLRALALPESDVSPPDLPYEDPRITRARALRDAASNSTVLGDYDASVPLLKRAFALSKEANFPNGMIRALNSLGLVAEMHGDHLTAQQRYREAQALAKEHPPAPSTVAWMYQHLALCADGLGDKQEAARLYREGLEIRRSIGDRRGIARALRQLGRMAAEAGDPHQAVPYYREAMQLLAELDDRYVLTDVLNWIADLALLPLHEDAPAAARLIGATNAIHAATGTKFPPKGRAEREKRDALLREKLGVSALETLQEEGATLPFDRVLEIASGILDAFDADGAAAEPASLALSGGEALAPPSTTAR